MGHTRLSIIKDFGVFQMTNKTIVYIIDDNTCKMLEMLSYVTLLFYHIPFHGIFSE